MNDTDKTPPSSQDKPPEWGEEAHDHYGYASDEERRAKRGLEDWELVEKIPESQHKVPYWFIAVVVAVTLVAVGLSFPFWGDRPGYERAWFDWGFAAALVWIVVGFTFVNYMINMYGSERGGRLDSDAKKYKDEDNDEDANQRPD